MGPEEDVSKETLRFRDQGCALSLCTYQIISNPFQHCGKPPLLLCLACFKSVARLATLVHSLEADKADWGWNWLVNLAVQVGAPWQKQLPVAKGRGSRKLMHAVRNKTKKARSIAAKCRKMKCNESHRTSWHRFALLRCILCLWQGICGIDHQSALRPSSRPFCEERHEADVEHPGCMKDRVDEMHLDVMKQELHSANKSIDQLRTRSTKRSVTIWLKTCSLKLQLEASTAAKLVGYSASVA